MPRHPWVTPLPTYTHAAHHEAAIAMEKANGAVLYSASSLLRYTVLPSLTMGSHSSGAWKCWQDKGGHDKISSTLRRSRGDLHLALANTQDEYSPELNMASSAAPVEGIGRVLPNAPPKPRWSHAALSRWTRSASLPVEVGSPSGYLPERRGAGADRPSSNTCGISRALVGGTIQRRR